MKWSPKADSLLGTMTDQKVADRLGIGRFVAQKRRRGLGIKASRPLIQWTSEMEALLGTKPDAEIAVILGLDYQRVRARRRVLGIPKFRFQKIPSEIPLGVRKASAAYLLGAYLSDGTLSWGGYGRDPHPCWGVRDESFADCISIALSNLGCLHDFRKVCRREFHHKDTWKVREKAAGRFGRWLLKVSPNKETLPELAPELVRPFVAGLMDGDGSVGGEQAEKDRFALSFSGGDGFVPKFRGLLESLGVRQGKLQVKDGSSYNRPCYDWTINIEDFLAAGLSFAMPRKQARLVKWCSRTIRSPYSDRYPRKVAVARWWMNKVYVRGWVTPVPMGRLTFPQ